VLKQDLGVLLSALETLAAEFEEGALRGEVATPSAHYFFFEGHRPNVVAQSGGKLTIVGSRLWQDHPPFVALVVQDREDLLGTPSPHRSGSDDAVAVEIDSSLIAEHRGDCLFLRARPIETAGVLWWKDKRPLADLYLPFCVPQSYGSRYRISGFLNYRTATRTRMLEPQEILLANSSCEDSIELSSSLDWGLSKGGRLIDMGQSLVSEVNASAVHCEITDNQISCAGRLDPAICGELFAGPSQAPRPFRAETEWHHEFSPTEEYPYDEEQRGAALSKAVELTDLAEGICVKIPRNQESDVSTMWFELIAVNGRQQEVVFSSPRKRVTETVQETHELGRDRIEVELKPGPVYGTAEICVRVSSSGCAY
jgi:hypothetical protein